MPSGKGTTEVIQIGAVARLVSHSQGTRKDGIRPRLPGPRQRSPGPRPR